MSEMVERVARAVAGNLKWGGLHENTRSMYRAYARAAIAAMREPTEEILEAGLTYSLQQEYPHSDYTKKGWQAMIDEALKNA